MVLYLGVESIAYKGAYIWHSFTILKDENFSKVKNNLMMIIEIKKIYVVILISKKEALVCLTKQNFT